MADSSTPPPSLPANYFESKPLGNYPATIIAVCSTLLSVCWICTLFRFYVRFRITRTPGLDDLFVGLTLVTVTMGTVAFCLATRFGAGLHIYEILDISNILNYLKCHYVMGAAYTSSTALIKVSLLCQYLRIFERGSIMYRVTQVFLGVTAIWGCVFSFFSWLCCLPTPAAFWNLTYVGCYGFASPSQDQAVATIESHAAINMCLDFVVLTIPVQLLFDKSTLKRTKYGLLSLLVMGIVITTFSIWRLQTILEHKAGFEPVLDPTWYGPEPTLISLCEVYISAICASTPIFWPVLTKSLAMIFVTYEVKVDSEVREPEGDELELVNTTGGRKSANSSNNGGADEPIELGRDQSRDSKRPATATVKHYADTYVARQVDPFAADNWGVQTSATTNRTHKKKKSFVVFKDSENDRQ